MYWLMFGSTLTFCMVLALSSFWMMMEEESKEWYRLYIEEALCGREDNT